MNRATTDKEVIVRDKATKTREAVFTGCPAFEKNDPGDLTIASQPGT